MMPHMSVVRGTIFSAGIQIIVMAKMEMPYFSFVSLAPKKDFLNILPI